MRFAPVAAIILGLGVLITLGQSTATRASEDRSISGTVFFDTNKNGQFDFGELPAPGRTVELSRLDRTPHSVDKVTSDAKGYYHFDHVPFNVSSLYVGVRTDEETGCVTGDTQEVDTEDSGMLRGKTAAPGSTVDLGALARVDGAATGTFTNDLNENGTHDPGEPPLKGWKLTLYGLELPNVYCYSEATTGSDGAFRLPVDLDHFNLFWLSPPSSVKVPWEWTAPTWADIDPDFAGQRSAPNGVTRGTKLDVMIHFSTGTASLSGTVFRDLDKDGVKDITDPFLDCSIAKGALQLSRQVPGIGAIEVHTTPTCVNGDFKFDQLEGGDYHIGEPVYLSLTEWYRPWVGRWVTIAAGQHAKDFVVALQPDKYPDRSGTPAPPPPVQPVARRSPDVPIVMPPAGSAGRGSNSVSAVAVLLTVAGLASAFMAILLHAYRPRRN